MSFGEGMSDLFCCWLSRIAYFVRSDYLKWPHVLQDPTTHVDYRMLTSENQLVIIISEDPP